MIWTRYRDLEIVYGSAWGASRIESWINRIYGKIEKVLAVGKVGLRCDRHNISAVFCACWIIKNLYLNSAKTDWRGEFGLINYGTRINLMIYGQPLCCRLGKKTACYCICGTTDRSHRDILILALACPTDRQYFHIILNVLTCGQGVDVDWPGRSLNHRGRYVTSGCIRARKDCLILESLDAGSALESPFRWR